MEGHGSAGHPREHERGHERKHEHEHEHEHGHERKHEHEHEHEHEREHKHKHKHKHESESEEREHKHKHKHKHESESEEREHKHKHKHKHEHKHESESEEREHKHKHESESEEREPGPVLVIEREADRRGDDHRSARKAAVAARIAAEASREASRAAAAAAEAALVARARTPGASKKLVKAIEALAHRRDGRDGRDGGRGRRGDDGRDGRDGRGRRGRDGRDGRDGGRGLPGKGLVPTAASAIPADVQREAALLAEAGLLGPSALTTAIAAPARARALEPAATLFQATIGGALALAPGERVPFAVVKASGAVSYDVAAREFSLAPGTYLFDLGSEARPAEGAGAPLLALTAGARPVQGTVGRGAFHAAVTLPLQNGASGLSVTNIGAGGVLIEPPVGLTLRGVRVA